MVEAAVNDEEGVAARLLAVDDSGDVYAGFADQVAAELEDDPRLGQRGAEPLGNHRREVVADWREVQRLAAFEVWDTEPTAEVDVAHRLWGCAGEPHDEVSGPAVASARISAYKFCEPANT